MFTTSSWHPMFIYLFAKSKSLSNKNVRKRITDNFNANYGHNMRT